MRINKSNIIKNVMADALGEHGFIYNGYKDKAWHFICPETNQEIVILRYRYDPTYYTFMMLGIRAIRASMLDNSEKFLDEYWLAKTEDEFKNLMEYFLRLIKSNGFDLLAEASEISKRDKIKMEISRRAFLNREDLFKRWLNRHSQTLINSFSQEDIDKLFNIFEEEYQFFNKDCIENFAQNDIDEFSEAVVIIGMLLEKFLGGMWKEYVEKNEYSFVITDMKAYKKSINLVNVFCIAVDKHNMTLVKNKIEMLKNGVHL